MLPCMASGRSGTDHAQTPPKAESLRVPVFRHHLPQTWVSSLFLFSFFHYLWLHARSLFSTCANLRVWNPLRHSSQVKLFTGKLRAALWPHASTEFRRCIFVRFFLRREVCSHIRSERLRSGNALCVKKKRKKKRGQIGSHANKAIRSIRIRCQRAIKFTSWDSGSFCRTR